MDIKTIREKIDELESYLNELETLLPEREDDYVNLKTKRACEKTFELACETLIDVCNIIISKKGYGKPTDNRDSVNKLAENSIISEDLGDRLKDMIGFRNLLVHRYLKVEDHLAFEQLTHEKQDFFEFIEVIDKFIEEE
ncbi:MAG: hypothetical protein AYK19_01195 [Theionarchaea archaeon DG-70-1]|nr:MAG: hypothetical protein AYK19_01195 [Theionarchaea archaeon DG-70-1]